MDIHRCRFVDYTPHTITSLAFSHKSDPNKPVPNDLRLAVGRSNGDIEIWNPRYNWTHEMTLPGSRGCSVEGLCWAVNDDEPSPRLFSIGGSSVVTEWDLSLGTPLKNYDCNAGVIWSLDVNRLGDKLAVGCDDGAVVIIDISGGIGSLEHDFICQRHNVRVMSVSWFSDDLVIGGCGDGRVRCWGTSKENKGRLLSTMRVDKSKTESTLVWSVLALPAKKQFATGDSTGSVKFWDIESFTLLQSFKVHDADVLTLACDHKQEILFTAGVDRKIHQFDLITSKNKVSKWVHSFNRLLHSNDVRSMAVQEGKGYNFLVSGGVERSIVIQSINNFQEGKYRKLNVSQQRHNIATNLQESLITLWQDQTVKIWKLFVDEFGNNRHKLAAKLSLSEDDNITDVGLNEDATLLAVARNSTVKLFQLSKSDDVSHKIAVTKVRASFADREIPGAKQVILFDNSRMLVLSIDNELLLFNMNIEDGSISFEGELAISENEPGKKSNLSFSYAINRLCLSKSKKQLALTRYNGVIELVNIDDKSDLKSTVLTRLASSPHLLTYSNSGTLLVLTEENKLYEFNTSADRKDESLLTVWSKRNSEVLPSQFLTLEDKPQGMFTEMERGSKKVWIYGSTWIGFFDLSQNIPLSKEYQKSSTNSQKKRNRDGLTINYEATNDEDGAFDNGDAILDENFEQSLKQAQIERFRNEFKDQEGENARPFWLTTKYRPIVFANVMSENGLVVIERPLFELPSTPSFNLPKLQI
ncbi:Piso0_000437 [Millerozyma farinosa CBS 7064]|uniref:Piso0_000437 protein n=1 Tax=Pichia sorbitophila (strain ATCC MYA-4447 / BCRC 22081 / CBS 7064 / NBRC 10061 / NRRL Y-12695) TaxID=559304 RepID=G8YTZ9_PICSO|nr:Piso0_000437 [Millerozyma farinosa CBS 7064]CCE73400.1 Piso0_000437 [Millerozyma farinosa CBS 7064]